MSVNPGLGAESGSQSVYQNTELQVQQETVSIEYDRAMEENIQCLPPVSACKHVLTQIRGTDYTKKKKSFNFVVSFSFL